MADINDSETKDFLQKRFSEIDTDSDGKIDIEEFVTFYRKITSGVSDAQAREVFHKIDVNSNRVVSFSEYIAFENS